jgi:hypothetical protein
MTNGAHGVTRPTNASSTQEVSVGRAVLCTPLAQPELFARQSATNHPERTIMKHYSLLLVVILAVTCSSLIAEEKSALQPNATVISLLQGSAGKSVELHLRSGEKMGGKVAQVTDNVVHLSNLTGAEYFDAFVDVKDISAVVVRVAGR